ncbi:MAG TPA: hypothetical protein VG938_13355 [Verrucomicrobiae bacterium]|jgi:hypothetical protein|nr:hypothetical protein [Verrucomicrobiae bacterium]
MTFKDLGRILGGKKSAGVFAAAALCLAPNHGSAATGTAREDEPRIVNIYNFIRNSDYRVADSENVMFDCTRRQIALLKQYNLPATWALQYDALINPRYQKLLKEQLGTNDEIAAWWEIPQKWTERAGIPWRGAHEWDPAANVGFSPGYTPEERRKLADVYMADFKAIFGHYPRTVGSWFIDEVTLQYLSEKYGIIASCNCKDQIGTDFYTLWGGYWNQAYYPSRVNSYMPAQTHAGQIDVPVFRMLGSDPIYQHGTTPGLISLEPVYRNGGGGMHRWVDWFMDNLVQEPSLAFAYTQAGQENSFGWDAMENGLTYQAKLFAELRNAGKIHVQTLEQSGRWFRKEFPLTPPTAVVAMDDWKDHGRKATWYDSRFYRLNILWDDHSFFIRDIHCFDENLVSPTHDTPLEATSLTYETLPVVDWAFWSNSGRRQAGMLPVLLSTNDTTTAMETEGAPVVKELNATELSIVQPLKGGGSFSIVCAEPSVTFSGVDAQGKPLNWAWEIAGGERLKAMVKGVDAASVRYSHAGVDYRLTLASQSGSCRQLDDGRIQLTPNAEGKLILKFDSSSLAAIARKPISATAKK